MTASARLLLLGIWIGSLLGFALIVPAAFSSLPGTELAAGLVGKALPQFDRLGIVLGLACTTLGLLAVRGGGAGPGTWVRLLLPLVAAVLHALSIFWVSPAAHDIRAAAGGSIQNLPGTDPLLIEFSRLHELSTGLYLGAALIVLLAAIWDVLSQRKFSSGRA
jgi:hypothetical protein